MTRAHPKAPSRPIPDELPAPIGTAPCAADPVARVAPSPAAGPGPGPGAAAAHSEEQPRQSLHRHFSLHGFVLRRQ